jgi:Tol biopolymer transport system component
MAPEQVEGREADARSDIWALGAVIYETVTGTRPFEGESAASIIGAILRDTPKPLSACQPLMPPVLEHVVARCLEKNPDDRWQTASDLGRELLWARSAPAAPADAMRQQRSIARLTPTVAALVTLGVLMSAAAAIWRSVSPTPVAPPPARVEIVPPTNAVWTPSPVGSAAQLAISPDGRRLAFVAARKGDTSQLWVRPLDRIEAQSLPGTEGASFPFWSPDGRFLGFFAVGKLKTIDTAGGGPQSLCDASSGRGGTWNAEGVILFSGSPNSVIYRIPASGGTATAVTKIGVPDTAFGHNWPQFLEDGRHFLFYRRTAQIERTGVYLGSLDSSTITAVLQSGSLATYASGRLLFARDGVLFAQRFDDRTLKITGEPIRIGDHVGYFTAALGYAAFTAASTGVLAYGPGVALSTSLRWLDRRGTVVGPSSAAAVYSTPRLSPDQTRVAVTITEAATPNRDIWVMDVARGTSSRATFDASADWFPAWAPDGARMFFGSTRPSSTSIFQRVGAGRDELVFSQSDGEGARAMYPNDVSADGRFLVYTQSGSKGYDLGVLRLTGERKGSDFLVTPFNEAQARFSPNARWIAYASDESGRFEVYVRPFPAANEQWKVSGAGGMQPEWRRDGKELFYIAADRKLMTVPVTIDGGGFSAGVPHALFDVDIAELSAPYPTEYTVSADG